MRSPKALLCLAIIACLTSCAEAQVVKIGVGLLLGASQISESEGRELLLNSLSSAKHLVPTVEIARLSTASIPRILLQAHEQSCDLAVIPSMASYMGPLGHQPGTTPTPNFALFRAKISYKLYRVSDDKQIASGSGESYGTARFPEHYEQSQYQEVVTQAVQRAVQSLVGDINKFAAKAATK
jgi:hypothetical protein